MRACGAPRMRPLVTGSMSLLHASIVAFGMTTRRHSLSVGDHQLADRGPGRADLGQLPDGLHADEAGASDLHFPRRVSRGHASGAGLDRHSRTSRPRSACAVRHHVSSGSSRTSTPSRGSTAKTTRTPASGCCRWWKAMAAPPRSPSCSTPLALVPVTLAPTLMGMSGWTYFVGAHCCWGWACCGSACACGP